MKRRVWQRPGWTLGVRAAIFGLACGALSLETSTVWADALVCTVKIDASEQLFEAFASGPSLEEASDAALENACALSCAPAEPEGEAERVDDEEGKPESDEPPPSEEAPKPAKEEPKPAKDAKKTPAPKPTADPDAEEPGDDTLAQDDPAGVEACVERCVDEGSIVGTICTNKRGDVVFVEGAFDPDGGSSDPDKGEGDEPEDDE